MHQSFREYHLCQALSAFEVQSLPLDVFLRNYFRKNKAVGSKDRKVICDAIYGMIRWRALIDHIGKKSLNVEERYKIFSNPSFEKQTLHPDIPAHLRVSFPKNFYEFLVAALGEEQATQFCLFSNQPAPTTVRVNLLKIDRPTLLSKWEKLYEVYPCKTSPVGITFRKKINFFALEEFKAGYFEVQDEASQLIASLIAIKPGERFLDYCAGSGGKSLAIAPQLQGKGQLLLHDIREQILQDAKKRLKRAGIQNAQLLSYDSKSKHTLLGKMDWILVDAPCSGTGTLRRNPDMKWKFSLEMVERLIKEQREIFSSAISFLKPGGHIVYATCSVLPQENEEQAAYFLNHFPLEQIGNPLSTLSLHGTMDGFFGIVFKKRKG